MLYTYTSTLIRCILITGANPTVFEVDGEQLTPLDYAVIGQHQELAQLLIENGALSISLVRDLAAICIQKVIISTALYYIIYTCVNVIII